MVCSLAFVGELVVDSHRSKFHIANPKIGFSIQMLLNAYKQINLRISVRIHILDLSACYTFIADKYKKAVQCSNLQLVTINHQQILHDLINPALFVNYLEVQNCTTST